MSTYIKLRNIKLVISFEHQVVARRTFIRLQLRKSSCDRVQLVLVLYSSPYLWNKKSFNRFHRLPKFRFTVYTFQTKKALDYLFPFLSFSVHNFCARTDGQTFFEKVFFFLPDQEYMHFEADRTNIAGVTPEWSFCQSCILRYEVI